jgi:hypothetical protein
MENLLFLKNLIVTCYILLYINLINCVEDIIEHEKFILVNRSNWTKPIAIVKEIIFNPNQLFFDYEDEERKVFSNIYSENNLGNFLISLSLSLTPPPPSPSCNFLISLSHTPPPSPSCLV